MPSSSFYERNDHLSDDDDNDDEILDSDEERMSFLGTASSRGTPSESPPRPKRMWVVIVSVCVLMILAMVGFTSFTRRNVHALEWSEEHTDRTNADSTPPPSPPPPLYTRPKTNDLLRPGYKKPLSELSNAYIPRAKNLTEEQRLLWTERWGYWNWTHPPPTSSTPPPYRDYPNQDVPRTAFPDGSWQTDTHYLEQFLPYAIHYVESCMDAILGEYGNSKYDQPDAEAWKRAWMFDITTSGEKYNLKHPMGNAGFATPATMNAIKKRILHALITEDTFIFVMGGHSAAAGHGNHFQQSYTLQVQRVLEPILARLGITHKSHNFGMGGLGTIQNALGAHSLYGDAVDILMWDSSMTEGDGPSRDLFARAGILAGTEKVPILWGRPDEGRYDAIAPGAGAILTGFWGMSLAGIPETQSAAQVKTLPYAARYLKCSGDASELCKNARYQSKCWISRPDGVEPVTKQKAQPGGQAKWHPGNRYHQLQGRAIAYQVLHQLSIGLNEWYNTPNYELPDTAWHLTSDFERIRRAVRDTKNTPCYELNIPDKVCEVPLQARSEFTPRHNPAMTSIRSIIKEGVFVPTPPKNMYDPPEPHIDVFDTPDPYVDVLSVVENGFDFVPNRMRTEYLAGQQRATRHRSLVESAENYEPVRVPVTSGLEPGQGWSLQTKSAPDNCDGSYDSFCGRSWDNDCLLSGHNDMRGGLAFDSLSGWLILNLEKVLYGVIMIRVEDWWGPNANKRTEKWVCENGTKDCPEAAEKEDGNGRRRTMYNASMTPLQRNLGENPNQCDSFKFEFAIDGKITSWDKTAWESNRRTLQRVVSVWVLQNGADYDMEHDIELAIRLTGCGRLTTFGLSHVYWA